MAMQEVQPEEATPKITVQQFNQLIGRIYDKHHQTQEKVSQQREQELQKPQFKPTISSVSQRIIKKKMDDGEYQPIQQRAAQIQQEKKHKYEQAQKMKTLQECEEKSQYTFRPNVGNEFEPRSVDQFLEQVDYWMKKKTQFIEQSQQEKITKELSGVTFKPKMNKNSERIVSENKDLNTTAQDRLQRSYYNRQQKEKKLIEEELRQTPFAPKINPKSKKIAERQGSISNQSPFRKQLNRTFYYGEQLDKSVDGRPQTPLRSHRMKTPSKSPINKTPTRSKTPTRTPLQNNRSIINKQPQEICYSPNLKFIVDLIDKRKH